MTDSDAEKTPKAGRYLPWRDGPGRPRPSKKIKTEKKDPTPFPKRNDDEDFKDDEYMRDGLKNDDYFIMVEDELLQVARSHTVKLHSAELSRLQEQLALRKAQRKESQSSQQPKITPAMPKHQQVIAHRRKQDATIKRVASEMGLVPSEEDEYNPQFVSRSLGRLMSTSAQKLDSVLPMPSTARKIKPATRAAAGFTKASHKLPSSQTSPTSQRYSSNIVYEDKDSPESEESDDLDFVPKRASKNQAAPSFPKAVAYSRQRDEPIISLQKKPSLPSLNHKSAIPRSMVSSSISSKPVSKAASLSKPNVIVLTDSDDDYADPEQAERWRRRREAAEARKAAAKS